MSKQPDDERIQDLMYLRKGAGLTSASVSRRPSVLGLCGTANPERAVEVITTALGAIGGKYASALQVAYGLAGEEANQLSARRSLYANAMGRHPDTIRDWEDRGIEALFIYLIAQRPLPDLPRPSFYLRRLKIDYTIVNRHFREDVQYREVMALADDAPYFRYGTSEEVILDLVKGGTYSEDTRTRNGIIHRITFPKRLRYSDEHKFSFRERRPVGAPLPAYERVADAASQLFLVPAERYDLSVTFVGEVPLSMWRFANMPSHEKPGSMTPDNRIHAQNGKVTQTFYRLHSGFATGIAWRW